MGADLIIVSGLQPTSKDQVQWSMSASVPPTQGDVLRLLLPGSRLEQYTSRVQVIIATLQRLSVVIRNPAPVDRYRKAKLIDVEKFRSYAASHLRELFHEIELQDFHRERTVAAMLDRRRFFEYCLRHHLKLADRTTDEDDLEQDALEKSQLSDTEVSSVPLGILQTVDINNLKTNEDDDGVSQTSYATSAAIAGHRVPGPPRDAKLGGDPFECPYCYLMIQPKDWEAWK
jgi:hypothetical protein